MLKVKNLERQQQNLVSLIAFAKENGFVSNGVPHSPVTIEFEKLFTMGSAEALTRPEITHLTLLTQTFLRLPVYTTTMASAWLGVGIDTVRDAVWRKKTMETMKPGHDVLITHGELVRFNNGKGDTNGT